MRTTVRGRLLAAALSAGTVLALVPSAAQADSTDYLADREPPSGYPYSTGPASVAGTTYQRSVRLDLGGEDRGDVVSVDVALAGKCRTLSGVLGLQDTNDSALRVRFSVLGDGVVKHEVETDKGVANPATVDVTGVRTLTLKVTIVQAAFFTQRAVFGDATVTCTGATPARLSAAASAPSVLTGGSVTFSGVVSDAGGSPVADQDVVLGKRENGEQEFSDLATARTDSAGRWSLTVRPRYSARYVASVPETKTRAAIPSSTQPAVVVRSALSINAQRLGTRQYRFYGTLRPGLSGRTVSLFRRAGGREVLVSRTTVGSNGVYDVRRTFTGSGRFDFLVRFAGDASSTAVASAVRPTSVY